MNRTYSPVKTAVFLCLFVFAFFRAFPQGNLPENVDFWSDYGADELSAAITDRMTDEELLAQVFMFGWAGAEPSSLLKRWVTERGLGSVKVFGWNTDDIHSVARSVKTLQEESLKGRFKIPLFVATDQEGGWIRHVKGETQMTPGNMAIGASGYPVDSYYSGYYISREIKALGINMNFAPVVDLYTDLKSSVIGPRSFGSDPSKVSILAEAFAKGSMDAGVIPTAKHFPGHGDTSLDSHGKLPVIDIDEETWRRRELVPFKFLIANKIPAIMSGHLSFPQLQGDGTPSSLSKKFLTDILRGELGYEGLIITDDMMMNGATEYAGGLARAVCMAIEAGNDIVISSSTAGLNERLWTDNLSRMSSTPGFRDRVRDAARRVLKAKLEYFKGSAPAPLFPDAATIGQFIPDKEGEKFFLEQACRAVTVYKGEDKLPYKPAEGERVLIAGPFLSLYSEGKKRYPKATTFHYSYELAADRSNYDEWNAASLVSVARNFDTIIINVWDEHTAGFCRRLRSLGKKVIILSIMSPVYVMEDFDWVDVIICGYSYSDYSFKALFAVLAGEIKAEGVLPL
ncbi:MAG: glycoside hydrolase family 3 protein [Treponema sp.]|nr:glycoside hydrolase family 3 protein [Treponema sp.]